MAQKKRQTKYSLSMFDIELPFLFPGEDAVIVLRPSLEISARELDDNGQVVNSEDLLFAIENAFASAGPDGQRVAGVCHAKYEQILGGIISVVTRHMGHRLVSAKVDMNFPEDEEVTLAVEWERGDAVPDFPTLDS